MTQYEAGWGCPQGAGVVDSPWALHVYLNQFQKGTTKLLPNIWLLKLRSIKEWISLLFRRKYSARTMAPPVTTTSHWETLFFSAANYPFPHFQQLHTNFFIWKQYNYKKKKKNHKHLRENLTRHYIWVTHLLLIRIPLSKMIWHLLAHNGSFSLIFQSLCLFMK